MAVRIPREKSGAPKPKHLFQESPHKEEAMQFIRDELSGSDNTLGISKLVKEVGTRFGLSEQTIYRYLKEVREPSSGRVLEAKSGSSTRVATGAKPTELAVITTRTPAPIVFVMGDLKIDLNPAHLYDAYRYCEDIKRMNPLIDDDFSVMVKGACKNAWEIVADREARRLGVTLKLEEEVN